MSTNTVLTADQAAEKFRLATTSATKWDFLDGVAAMCADQPALSQKEVVDQIGDTVLFQQMHGDHRDAVEQKASKAKSKLKSIRDELAVVKVWAPADRVDGVSFEAHKVLNRIGSKGGGNILTALVKEMGGPGNVTKAAVSARLKAADPDHKPQANGKKPAAGNQPVTGSLPGITDLSKVDAIMLATVLADKLTVGDLSKDADLAKVVRRIVDTFEAFDARSSAKSAATAPKKAAAKRPAASSSAKRKSTAKSSVKAPAKKAAPKRAAAPKVKVPA